MGLAPAAMSNPGVPNPQVKEGPPVFCFLLLCRYLKLFESFENSTECWGCIARGMCYCVFHSKSSCSPTNRTIAKMTQPTKNKAISGVQVGPSISGIS